MDDQIGDVAMHKNFTGQQAHNLVGRNPAIRASNPEVFRTLLMREFLKEFGVIFRDLRGPAFVIFKEFFHRVRFYRRFRRQA